MKKFIFIYFLLISFSAISQNSLWPVESPNTGLNSTYLVHSVSIYDGDLLYGKIGAFFTNDSGELQCGGFAVWSGSPVNISVQANDITTEQKDGFDSGEEIIWLGTNDNGLTTFEASVTYLVGATGIGSSIFTPNSINIISPFTISHTQYCVNDADGDGICDENESAGCTDPGALYYNPFAEVDDGSCIDIVFGCTDEDYDNYDYAANTDDGTCIMSGCMNQEAENYNENANIDDGSCIIAGCTDSNKFNYNIEATVDDNSCLESINIEYVNVPTSTSINYNILANTTTFTLGSSEISAEGDIIGAFQIINGELVCVGYNPWEEGDISIVLWLDDPITQEVDGYVSSEAIYWVANQNSTGMNYLLNLTINEFNIVTEINVNTNLTLGCTDSTQYNYDEDATFNDGSCYPFVYGCMDSEATNFNAGANTSDGSCFISGCPYDDFIEFNPNYDSIDVSLCQTLIVYGCTNNYAENYNPQANIDDGSCNLVYGCTDHNADNYNEIAFIEDFSCIYMGCIDINANNFDANSNTNCSSCCEYLGCTNQTAVNYDNDATVDDGSCIIYGCTIPVYPNYNSLATNDDLSCDFNSNEIFGCTHETAFNHNPLANINNGSCIDVVFGCTDEDYDNYNSAANDDNGSCCNNCLTITTTVCSDASSVRMTGPWWQWNITAGPEFSDNGDGTWTFTFNHEFDMGI